ncbi:membrane protease YdiL (CAAX protease family) [Mesoflavibacter sabulilitoris]|uniref:Uncharacterized protein n=1 Tax=Mesoflavibacter zeaxanthinifaciens subsp. sabulilitoris TaxID=1520893 RepID=A0A2T1NGP8_9FLAO|nr:hypothetical protein [Mesoflavibacter zeaxanthinifaciens]MBB3122978.1 membrane protease YdiL (CAAX protease family) [Mesoflavibacter zeaxanthinifaciens subsp. sabulilitoris]PSG91952.1 hypothetical protein C7H61_05085 [Mesoflavibacter zeaxanthinifaciens subsp. sabulilitoris]
MKTILKIIGLAILYLIIVYVEIIIAFLIFGSGASATEKSSTLTFQLIVYFIPLVIVILIGKRVLK